MKNVVVIANILKDEGLSLTKRIIYKLRLLGFCVFIDEKTATHSDIEAIQYSQIPENTDLIIVVGGDGSVIDASHYAIQLDIPLLGVNLGKVGYLATLEPDNIDLLDNIASGEYIINDRMLLSVELHNSDSSVIKSDRLAVNDVIIGHSTHLGISEFKVENAGGDQVKYRADGVVLSTPAGSTAYSLSAGGPVISHTLDSITVTPICPHSFFNRAIVYGPEERIKITNIGDGDMKISIDGRFFTDVTKGNSCIIRKSDKKIKMMAFGAGNLFSTLSKKIKHLDDTV